MIAPEALAAVEETMDTGVLVVAVTLVEAVLRAAMDTVVLVEAVLIMEETMQRMQRTIILAMVRSSSTSSTKL